MAHRNTDRKKSALAELLFPSAAPAVMQILSVAAAAVLITGGVLLASGYFSGDDVANPEAAVTQSAAQAPETTPHPQDMETAEPTVRPEIIPAGLSLRGGSGNVYYTDDAIVLHVGDTAFLELLADGEPADETQITWKSFDESVFTVTGGVLSAISSGEAQCRATYSANNQSISITVTVKELQADDVNPDESAGTTPSSYQDTPASVPAQSQQPLPTTPAQEEPSALPAQTPNIALTPVEPPDLYQTGTD